MTLVIIEELSKVCDTSGLILTVRELGSLGIKLQTLALGIYRSTTGHPPA